MAQTPATKANEPTAKALIERHAKEKSAMWADGDKATFFFQGEAGEVTLVVGGDTKKMKRLPDSDVWTLTMERPGLQKGVFTYFVVPHKKGEPPFKRGERLKPVAYRGPEAPPAPAVATLLRGKERKFDFPSKSLGTTRKVNVYLPPKHDKTQPTAVIYATDGQTRPEVLEPLIVSGKIRPVIVIGAAPGEYMGKRDGNEPFDFKKDLRALEYLPGADDERFKKHEVFFCEELSAWAQKEFGASADRKDKGVLGCSNGARFAIEMGLRHPELFGHVLAFSVAGDSKLKLPKADVHPHYYLAAGTWEKSFHKMTQLVYDQFVKASIPVDFHSRISGHDDVMWRDEFVAAVLKAYPPASK
jgi:enterochelin esterase-like enzyme